MQSLPNSGLSIRELDVLFDQSPIPMVFGDCELRARRTNEAFRRLVGLPDEAILGRRPSDGQAGTDTALAERTLAEQVINRGVPVVDMHIEQTLSGKRRVLSWSAYRVTDDGQVLGAVGLLIDVTDRVQANARLDLLERASRQIGTTLDIHRTAEELAALAVPELADRISVDLCDEVLRGEDLPVPGSLPLRLRRVAVRDGATRAKIVYPGRRSNHRSGHSGRRGALTREDPRGAESDRGKEPDLVRAWQRGSPPHQGGAYGHGGAADRPGRHPGGRRALPG